MRNPEKETEKRRCFFHGGCAVLYLHMPPIAKRSPALSHLGALIDRLCAYTEQVLLPAARNALNDAVAKGEGYRFCPHHVYISLTETSSDRGTRFALTFSLLVEKDSLWTRELVTYWDSSGQIQRPRAPRFPRRRSMRSDPS